MKLITVLFMLLLSSTICYLSAAAPNLDYLTEDDCRGCHGDEKGNTILLHHQLQDCLYCHEMPLQDDWRHCYNCHADLNHHDDARGRCSDCHDDKQMRQQRG